MDDWDFNEEFDDDEGNEIEQDIDEVKESRQTEEVEEDPEEDENAEIKKKELVRYFLFHSRLAGSCWVDSLFVRL